MSNFPNSTPPNFRTACKGHGRNWAESDANRTNMGKPFDGRSTAKLLQKRRAWTRSTLSHIMHTQSEVVRETNELYFILAHALGRTPRLHCVANRICPFPRGFGYLRRSSRLGWGMVTVHLSAMDHTGHWRIRRHRLRPTMRPQSKLDVDCVSCLLSHRLVLHIPVALFHLLSRI